MKRWHFLGDVFLVVAAALLLTSNVGGKSPCEVADSLRAAKMYEDAQAAYATVLKNDSLDAPQRDCALTGIKELQRVQAEKFYNSGKTYENANQLNDARNAYIEALKIDPNFSDARTALARISDPFAEVRTLANKGLYTDAVDRFKKIVENNPNISVPDDLNYLFGGKIYSWRLLKLQTEPWILSIREILVLIAIVVLAGFAFYYRIYPWIRGFHNPILDIEDFDKGTTDLDIGKGVKALVEESYNRLGEGSPRVHLVDKPIEKLDIPADIKGAPYFAIVSQLIEWVLPRNVITLNGYLQASGSFGAGMTLALVNKRTGEIMANHTIWQKDFDPTMTQQVASVSKDSTAYYRLAKLAAIWMFFQLDRKKITYLFSWDKIPGEDDGKLIKFLKQNFCIDWLKNNVNFEKSKDNKTKTIRASTENNSLSLRLNDEKTKVILTINDRRADEFIVKTENGELKVYIEIYENFVSLGTQDWLSFAYLRAGAFWTLEGYKVKARQLYIEALNQDINHRSVWFNLGYLDIEDTIEHGDHDYDRAIKRLSQAEKLSEPEDPLKPPEDYLWYLAKYQLSAAYHYRSIQFKAKKDIDKATRDLNQAEKESRVLMEKIDAAINNESQSSVAATEKKLKQFLQKFRLNANIMHASIMADQGKIDKAESKINRIKSECSKFSYRVHYNFACYYSILGNRTKADNKEKSTDAYKKALSHLKCALERGGDIINWAQKDPSLEGIRKDKKDDFDKLIGKYAALATTEKVPQQVQAAKGAPQP